MKIFIKKNIWVVFLISFALSFLIFGNSIKGAFVFDDSAVVEKRGDLKDLSNFWDLFVSPYHQNTPKSGLYRPLTMASYALNYSFFGQSTTGFHVINIIIHALNSVLVFLLVDLLFKKRRLSFFCLFLFISHPIHTEAVAWITGRSELLALFWSLLTTYLFIKNKPTLSGVALLLALWSKETAIMILTVIAFVSVINQGNGIWKTIRKLANYLPALVVYSILRFAALGKYTLNETATTMVENPLKFSTLAERVSTSFKILFLYIEKLFWPAHLSADYSYNTIKIISSVFHSPFAIAGVVVMGVLVVLICLRKFRSSPLALGSLLFVSPYLLISNLIIPIGTIMGERLVYFPSVGFVLIVCYLLYEFGEVSLKWKKVSLVFVVILVTIFSARTIIRNNDWHDNESLFRAALKESQDGLLVHTSLAAVDIKNNKWAEAEKELAAAQNIYKDNSHELNLLGIMADHKGNFKLAEELYKKSIELSNNPINTYINLANLYLRQGRYQEAGDQMLKIIEFNPIQEYVVRYSYTQIAINKPEVAVETIKKYYGDKINTPDLNAALGTAYYLLKNYQKAILYLEAAKSLGKIDQQIDIMINVSREQLKM